MAKSNGLLAWLLLASGVLALPLSAEEITVTVPPDPPAQSAAPAQPQAEPQTTKPIAQNTSPPQEDAQPPQEPAAASPPEAPTPTPPPQATANPPAPPVTTPAAPPVHKKPKAKAAAVVTEPASEAAGGKDAASKPKATKAAKHKVKKAKASCKGLDENACGGNSACIWVVGTPEDGPSKATKARCRSLAVLKKEAKKADKADKSEVLPWAEHKTESAGASPATATKEAEVKHKTVKKKKTAAVKKAVKSTTAAAPAQAPPAADAASPSDAPSVSENPE